MTGWHELGGTIRARMPDETWSRLQPVIERIGITRVARIGGLDHLGLAVSTAVRPRSRLLATSQGKGLTPLLADISAVMEGLESHCAETLRAPDVEAAAADLDRDYRIVPPARLRQHRVLRRPVGLDETIGWVLADDLIRGGQVLIPHRFFDMDTTDPALDRTSLCYRITTTGLAGGNTAEEALLHGLCEAIERDAVVRFDQLPPRAQAARLIDPTTVASPVAAELLERLGSAQLEVRVADITGPVGLPAFRATLMEPAAATRTFRDEGMGAHLSAEIALVRALTEAAQSRACWIAGARDDLFPPAYQLELAAFQLEQPAAVAPAAGPWSAVSKPSPGTSFAGALASVIGLLRAAGIEDIFAFQHTAERDGFAVVHVVVPDLADGSGLS